MAKITAGVGCSHVPAIGVAMDTNITGQPYWEPVFKGFEFSREWMKENWHISLYYIGAYMFFIVAGQHYMQSRPKFELRNTLALWNFFLAVFSIIGTMRTVPEMMHVLRNFGLHHSCCVGGPR